MFFDFCINLTRLADCFIFLCFEFWVWLWWLIKLGGKEQKREKNYGFFVYWVGGCDKWRSEGKWVGWFLVDM